MASFGSCYCSDCKWGEWDSGRQQYYCNHPSSGQDWHDADDSNSCVYYED